MFLILRIYVKKITVSEENKKKKYKRYLQCMLVYYNVTMFTLKII